jgi:hypothetical protein
MCFGALLSWPEAQAAKNIQASAASVDRVMRFILTMFDL